MGKAQEQERCHKCNASFGAGARCKCSVRTPTWPDRAPFVRDMLADLARTVGDPLRSRSEDVEQAQRNDALGEHEKLARFCEETLSYLDRIAGLSRVGSEQHRAERILGAALRESQLQLRDMAWPERVRTTTVPVPRNVCKRCGGVFDTSNGICGSCCSAHYVDTGGLIDPQPMQSTPGGVPVTEGFLGETHGRNVVVHHRQLEMVRSWRARGYISFTYAKVRLVDGQVWSCDSPGQTPLRFAGWRRERGEPLADTLKKGPAYVVFAGKRNGAGHELLYVSNRPMAIDSREEMGRANQERDCLYIELGLG